MKENTKERMLAGLVISVLMERNGFFSWWDAIEGYLQESILEEIETTIVDFTNSTDWKA